MADLDWPAGLAPYRVLFYLQPHVGRSQSPMSRVTKVYGLSAPRWVARLSFRGGTAGAFQPGGAAGYGPRLDGLIAVLEGGLTRVRLHDWRRPGPVRPQMVRRPLFHVGAAAGDTILRVGGFEPRSAAFSVGDYVGGDGRPHMVTQEGLVDGIVYADAAGVATFAIKPPVARAIAAGTLLVWPVTGVFRLTSDDAGQNEAEVGELTEYAIDFEEDLD